MLSILPISNIIVFESHSDFCDNSKAIFNKVLHYNLNKKYKIYWFVDNTDNNIFQKYKDIEFVQIKHNSPLKNIISELKRAILLTKCKYYFFSHRNLSRSKPRNGQIFFNLTHGTPLKDSTGRHHSISKSTYILTTSEFAGDLRIKTYGEGSSKLKILGFPRNDFLFEDTNAIRKLGYSKESFNKIIVWMPTFRRHKNSKTNDTNANEHDIDIPIIDSLYKWDELNDFLSKRNVFLIIKIHPAQDMKFIKITESSNIRLVTNDELFDKEIELYNLLGESDSLITDYSSVFLDYLILDRPIGFTIDDLIKYKENLGFLVSDPLEYMPGEKIQVLEDMYSFIENVCNGYDAYKEHREKANLLFNKFRDNKSADRVLEFIEIE